MVRFVIRLVLVALIYFSGASFLLADGLPSDLSQQSDEIFKEYVRDGLVDYPSLKKNRAKLDEVIRYLAKIDSLEFSSKNQELAFWINTYNILVLHSVVEVYPIKSPMDVSGFFDQQVHSVGNKKLTLNDIENKIIRPKFKDARIHFALVCAAMGCPILIDSAFFGETLDQQLKQKSMESLNNEKNVRVDKKSKKIFVTEIFKWYKDDFTEEGKTIIDFINKYHDEQIPDDFSINFIQYDWTLNVVKSKS